MTRFDWPTLMQAGLCGLRLKPDEFWRLTPAELEMMLGPQSGVKPMARGRLDELIRAFPDTGKGHDATKRQTDDGL